MATPLKALCAVTVLSILSAEAAVSGQLETRKFEINLDQLHQVPIALPDEQFATDIDQTDSDSASLKQHLDTLLRINGIKFRDATLAHDAKRNETVIFFNDRTGSLMVRATNDELEKIRNALQIVCSPPRVLIEAVFAETVLRAPSVPFKPTTAFAIASTSSSSSSNPSVLTEKQAQVALKELETTSATIQRLPTFKTASGRRAVLAMEKARDINYQTPPQFPPDASLDADPTPYNVRRLPLSPGFVPTGLSSVKTLIIRGDRN